MLSICPGKCTPFGVGKWQPLKQEMVITSSGSFRGFDPWVNYWSLFSTPEVLPWDCAEDKLRRLIYICRNINDIFFIF